MVQSRLGFSLIEILVSTAIGAIVALGGAYVAVDAAVIKKKSELSSEELALIKYINLELINNPKGDSICSASLLFASNAFLSFTGNQTDRVSVQVPLGPFVNAFDKYYAKKMYFSDWSDKGYDTGSRKLWIANLYIQFEKKQGQVGRPLLVGSKLLVVDPITKAFAGCLPLDFDNLSRVCARRGMELSSDGLTCRFRLDPLPDPDTPCSPTTGRSLSGVDDQNQEVCRALAIECPRGQYLVSMWKGRPICSSPENEIGNWITENLNGFNSCARAAQTALNQCMSICLSTNGDNSDMCAEQCATKEYQNCADTIVINISAPGSEPYDDRDYVNENKCLCGSEYSQPSNWIPTHAICGSCFVQSEYINGSSINKRILVRSRCLSGSLMPLGERELAINEIILRYGNNQELVCNGEHARLQGGP